MSEMVETYTMTVTDIDSGATSRVRVATSGDMVALRIGGARWMLSKVDAAALANALDGGSLDAARVQVRRVEALNDALRLAGFSIESLTRALESKNSAIRKSLVVLAVESQPKTSPEEKEKEVSP